MSQVESSNTMQQILIGVNESNKSVLVNPQRKDTVTLEMVVSKWRVLIAPQQKPRGRAASESHLKAHILPKLGNYPVESLSTELTRPDISNWLRK